MGKTVLLCSNRRVSLSHNLDLLAAGFIYTSGVLDRFIGLLFASEENFENQSFFLFVGLTELEKS